MWSRGGGGERVLLSHLHDPAAFTGWGDYLVIRGLISGGSVEVLACVEMLECVECRGVGVCNLCVPVTLSVFGSEFVNITLLTCDE